MNWLKIVFERLVFSNVFVAIAAACMGLETLFLLRLTSEGVLPITGMLFFSTLFIYNFQRLVRMSSFSGSYSGRLYWMVSNRKVLIALSVISAVGMLVSASFLTYSALMILGISGMVSFAYTLPVIRYGKQRLMFRDIPFIKIFLIAITWVLATVVVPYVNAGPHEVVVNMDISMIIIQRFLFIFSITLPFDIRDMKYDREEGLRTIPLKIGIGRAKWLAVLLQLIAALLATLQYLNSDALTAGCFAGLLLSYTITAFVISFANEKRPELYFSGLLEGMMVLQFLLTGMIYVID